MVKIREGARRRPHEFPVSTCPLAAQSAASDLLQRPGLAEFAREHRGRAGVVDELACGAVELELTTGEDRGVTEVADGGRVVRGHDVRDGAATGLHAVDEFLIVVGRARAAPGVRTEVLLPEARDGARLLATGDEEFALLADEAHAHERAADRQLEAVGVAHGVVIFGMGVPRGFPEFARAFDGDGILGVLAHRPSGDVRVVADPVEQLPAAEVHVPAPVEVEDAGVVGELGRRPDPHVVIDFGRDLLARLRSGRHDVFVRAGADLDLEDLAEHAVAHELDAAAEVGGGALPHARLPDAAVLLHRVGDGLALGPGLRERLLAVDVDAGAQERAADHAVPMVRQAVDRGVGLLLREHLAEVDILLRRGHALLDDVLGSGLQHAAVDVADGDDLDALLGHQLAHVASALGLQADADELEAVTRGDRAVLAERRGRDDGGEAEHRASEGGVLQERATIEGRHRGRGKGGTGVAWVTFRGKEGKGRSGTTCRPRCKSANRPAACAKVQ